MKTRKLLLIILAFVGAMHSINANAQTHPFFPPNSTQMLWYWQPDSSVDSVWIVAPNVTDWGTYTKPSGDLVIPADIPNTNYHVQGILSYAFKGCDGLRSVEVSDGISIIGIESFKDCTGMTDITLGKDVSDLNENAFQNCTGLTFIRSRSRLCACSPNWDATDVFEGVPNTIPVYIPCGTKIYYSLFWKYLYFSEVNFIEDLEASFTVSLSVNSSWQGIVEVTEWGSCEDPYIEITATPNSGYHFEAWNDGNIENPRMVQLVSDTAFVANFEYGEMHTVTICSEDSIMGYTVPEGTFEYPYNTSLSIEAIPHEGYHFVKWKEDGYTLNPRTIYVWGDKTYTAVFAGNTSVDENDNLSTSVYPNPTKDKVIVETENIKHISISNMMGQLVFEGAAEGDSFEYDFSSQEAGVYLIRIETSNGTLSKQIIVIK